MAKRGNKRQTSGEDQAAKTFEQTNGRAAVAEAPSATAVMLPVVEKSESQTPPATVAKAEPLKIASGDPIASAASTSNGEQARRLREETPNPFVEEPAAPVGPAVEVPEQPPLFFEVAWEVCWQLGGIYTVLKTKIQQMIEKWGDRYCLIGPYNPTTAAVEFEERPTDGHIRETLDRLRRNGIPCHYGRWLIPGRPNVILLDYRARFWKLGDDLYTIWRDHGITSSTSDGEVNEVVAFGMTVADFFRELSDVVKNRRIIGQFHEWMGGLAVPRIAHMKLPIATVFTTHATLLGRYLASDNPYFYDHLPFFNGDEQAAKYNILAKHQIEKAAAHASTVFTTVSSVTAFEAEKLLGRNVDVVVPNGINLHRFAALHEFQNLHQKFKEKIHDFVMGHFFPSYSFDLDRTLYFFTSGRYEYKNKGMDLFIDSMARLNQRLKTMDADKRPTVVAFIITKAQTRNINVGTLQNQSMFNELKNMVGELGKKMERQLLRIASVGRLPEKGELLDEDGLVRLKQGIHAWRNRRQPTIVTHDLADDAGDPVLKHIRQRGLFNAADDPVKMVFHPEFVKATSPLLGLDYNDFVRGCHMGVFPSYYEPWGYTPLECAVLGVPSITTDLSGFGAYVQEHIDFSQQQGMTVVGRRYKSFDDTADELTDHLLNFCRLQRRQRIELRNRVERLGEQFDWGILIKHYNEAYDLALLRTSGAKVGAIDIRMV